MYVHDVPQLSVHIQGHTLFCGIFHEFRSFIDTIQSCRTLIYSEFEVTKEAKGTMYILLKHPFTAFISIHKINVLWYSTISRTALSFCCGKSMYDKYVASCTYLC